MQISPNTCNVCWNGQYVNGICTSCQSKKKTMTERRSDALPLRTGLKQRYIIGDVLGNGGFGITYSAWDNTRNCRVALKELYPRNDVCREGDDLTIKVIGGQKDFQEMMVRFENEAQLLQSLSQDCDVIKVYDLFHANGTVYYSMEYLDGYDLRTYLVKNGPMKWEFLRPKLLEVLQTLDVLHAKNLIHRDISPDNLFLTRDNKVRLIDFGSVRTYQGNETITTFLKPHFAPLEQYKTNGKQGPYTDIYALSVTVYMLLTGKIAPSAPDRVMSAAKVIPLKTLCPQLPDYVAKAVEKGMSLKAEDRFQTAGEYIQALGGAPKPSVPPTPPKPPIPTVPPVPPVPPAPQEQLTYWIQGRSGFYAGKRKRLEKNKEIRIGRLEPNEIPFPNGTFGVSREQCSIFISATGDIFVKDRHSRYGTYLNEQKVGENWTRVPSGSYLRIGGEMLQLYYTGE